LIVPLLVKEADPVVPLIGLYKLTLENCKFKFIDPETRTSPKKLIRQDKFWLFVENTHLPYPANILVGEDWYSVIVSPFLTSTFGLPPLNL